MLLRGFLIVLVAASSAWGQCVPPPDGLAAWWPLDEPSGLRVEDVAGRHDGALANHAGGPLPESAPGMVRGALRFHGAAGSDHVSVPDDAAFHFDLDQKFSIAAWIRSEPGVGRQPIVSKMSVGPTDLPFGWMLFLNEGTLTFEMSYNDGGAPSRSWGRYDGVNLSNGSWHLVAVAVAPGEPNGGALYIDDLPPARFDPTTLAHPADSGAPLRIGQIHMFRGGPAYSFFGDIDEVQIYRGALAPADIGALYAAGGAGACLPVSIEPAAWSRVKSVFR